MTFRICKFQMICTGTFYDEWLDEKPWLPLHIFLTIICISLHLILLLFIKISQKNFERGIENKHSQHKEINFGTNLSSLVIYGLIISGLMVLGKFNRYNNTPFYITI